MPFFFHLRPNPASEKQNIRGASQCGAENRNKPFLKISFSVSQHPLKSCQPENYSLLKL